MSVTALFSTVKRLPFSSATALAVPMILANISTPLMGIADTAMLGRLDDASFLGGVAVGVNILTLLFWMFAFLRMSMTAAVGKSYGTQKIQSAIHCLMQSTAIALFLSLLLIALHGWYLPLFIGWVSQSIDVNQHALAYSYIRIWSAPCVLLTYVCMGWLMGAQSMRAIVIITLVLNGLNIALDYVFILVFSWEVKGAAWATLISEYCAFCLTIVFMFNAIKSRSNNTPAAMIKASIKRGIFSLRQFIPLFKTNSHLFVRTLLLLLVFNFFTAQGGVFGDDVIAANAILLQLMFIGVFAVDGYAYAGETMIARAIGAKRIQNLHNITGCVLCVGIAISVFFTVFFAVSQPYILHVMTSINSVKSAANDYYIWLLFMPIMSVACYIFDGLFIGAGKTKALQQAMIISVFGVFLPVWWFSLGWGNHGLWFALVIFHLSRGVTLIFFYIKITRKSYWFV